MSSSFILFVSVYIESMFKVIFPSIDIFSRRAKLKYTSEMVTCSE